MKLALLSPDGRRGMNTFIPKTSGPGRRVSVWADSRVLLTDTTIEPGCIFSTGNLSGLTVGPDVSGVLPLVYLRPYTYGKTPTFLTTIHWQEHFISHKRPTPSVKTRQKLMGEEGLVEGIGVCPSGSVGVRQCPYHWMSVSSSVFVGAAWLSATIVKVTYLLQRMFLNRRIDRVNHYKEIRLKPKISLSNFGKN